MSLDSIAYSEMSKYSIVQIVFNYMKVSYTIGTEKKSLSVLCSYPVVHPSNLICVRTGKSW